MSKFRVIPFRRENVKWNLALEEALFLKAKERLKRGEVVQPTLKLYSFSGPSVVLGHRQKMSEIDFDYCENQGVDVTMRTTGGGSVFLGENDLQYSLILDKPHSLGLLKDINSKLSNALENSGFPASLKSKNNHPIVRVDGRGSIFDAQRRFKNILLHHGTTLVDDFDYEHMPLALKATSDELRVLREGNLWLRNLREVREKALIKAYKEEFVKDSSFVVKDYTSDELKLAKELYRKYYNNTDAFKDGKKSFGICYLTDSDYDMDWYAELD